MANSRANQPPESPPAALPQHTHLDQSHTKMQGKTHTHKSYCTPSVVYRACLRESCPHLTFSHSLPHSLSLAPDWLFDTIVTLTHTPTHIPMSNYSSERIAKKPPMPPEQKSKKNSKVSLLMPKFGGAHRVSSPLRGDNTDGADVAAFFPLTGNLPQTHSPHLHT